MSKTQREIPCESSIKKKVVISLFTYIINIKIKIKLPVILIFIQNCRIFMQTPVLDKFDFNFKGEYCNPPINFDGTELVAYLGHQNQIIYLSDVVEHQRKALSKNSALKSMWSLMLM